MCDYSLNAMQIRLAEDGDKLALHKFGTGTLGFASVCDVAQSKREAESEPEGFWPTLKALFSFRQPSADIPAVCIPPGARIFLTDVPQSMQDRLSIGPSELAVFTEISSRVHTYRDALILSNGKRVLLQELPEGLHATVLSTSLEAAPSPREAGVLVPVNR